jgi:hypothetical protein
MNIYYVYAYISENTGLPYYIGKGKDNRAFCSHKRNNKNFTPKNKDRIVILEKNLTNLGALAIERRLIQWYGKKHDNTGILINFTDGGEDSAVFGWHHSEESKQKMRLAKLGKKLGPNSVPSPQMGIPRPDDVKQKISEKLKGRVIGDNIKKSLSAKNRQKITCPHCDKTGDISMMKRWHFDKCRIIS